MGTIGQHRKNCRRSSHWRGELKGNGSYEILTGAGSWKQEHKKNVVSIAGNDDKTRSRTNKCRNVFVVPWILRGGGSRQP